MNKITKIITLITLTLVFVSCKNEKSLQSYLVETNGKDGFYTGDLPIKSLLSAKEAVSEEVKQTLQSVKKVNIVFLPKTEENTAAYEKEKATLLAIFKDNKNYKSLLSMKIKDMNMRFYYSGNTTSIAEVIVFGYGEKNGVGVARLLGENMNPSKIIEMLNNVNFDENNVDLKQLTSAFKVN